MFLLTFCHKKCHLSNNLLFYPCFDDVVHTKILCLLVCLTFPFTLNDSLAAWFRLPPPRRPQLQQRSSALTQLCLRKCKCVQRNPVWRSVIAFNATPVWESVNAFNATLCAVWNKTACTKSPTSWCSTLYAMNGRKYYWPFRFPLKGQDNEMGFYLMIDATVWRNETLRKTLFANRNDTTTALDWSVSDKLTNVFTIIKEQAT